MGKGGGALPAARKSAPLKEVQGLSKKKPAKAAKPAKKAKKK